MSLTAQTPEHRESPVTQGDREAELSPDLVHVARWLHEEYDVRLGRDLVDQEIQLSAAKLTDAPLRAFVPLFVARFTGAALSSDCRHLRDGEAEHGAHIKSPASNT